MSPRKAMLIGVLLYLLSMFMGAYNMWYIRQGYNVTVLTGLTIVHLALSFSSIGLVGYGALAYLITVIREAVRKREESGGE